VGWRDWSSRTVAVPAARPIDGWRVAGDDVYTVVCPPGFEKDPAVTDAIREFDPEIIPAWRIQLWHPPGEMSVLKVVHHGIMRHYPYPRFLRTRFFVELPQGWDGPEPNFLDVFFQDESKTNHIGPPAYMPWDWSVYRYCRANWIVLTQEKYKKRVERHRERIAEARRKHLEELAYRRRHFEKTALPILEGVTPEDWKEYEQLRMRRGRSARKVSIVVPGQGSPPKALNSDPGRPR
jgi:hypothetical protein